MGNKRIAYLKTKQPTILLIYKKDVKPSNAHIMY